MPNYALLQTSAVYIDRPARERKPLVARSAANQEWALDFAHDAVACGRAIRVLSVVDAYTRQCLALEVDTSFGE
jgi:putative transposase